MHLHIHVYYSMIHKSQDMEPVLMTIKNWMDQENVVMYPVEFNSAIKNEIMDEIMEIMEKWMRLENI